MLHVELHNEREANPNFQTQQFQSFYLQAISCKVEIQTMDMHILMSCDILLEKKNYRSIDEKVSYLGNYNNALSIFTETINLLNVKTYLFERRGFYSNPKTENTDTIIKKCLQHLRNQTDTQDLIDLVQKEKEKSEETNTNIEEAVVAKPFANNKKNKLSNLD